MKKSLLVFILFFSYDAFSQTAEEYFDRAYDKVENGDYYGGIADYTKAIELEPNDASALLQCCSQYRPAFGCLYKFLYNLQTGFLYFRHSFGHLSLGRVIQVSSPPSSH